MKQQSSKKREIFLLLALRQAERRQSNEFNDSANDFLQLFYSRISAPQVKQIKQIYEDYLKKSESEKQVWRKEIENYIGSDEITADENIHRSHIENALKNETPAIREIITAGLHSEHRKYFDEAESEQPQHFRSIAKIIRKTFARQFISLDNLKNISAFDRLSGARLARLARQAGIREVALACLRITAVESVAAFLRRFSAEDARAIAAQMSNLPDIRSERLSFAENLVQSVLEVESQPSAMLDLLGIRLIGILLCESSLERVKYTAQKLPLEVAPKLSEIIEAQCQKTPADLQNEIGKEIEQLAENMANTSEKVE